MADTGYLLSYVKYGDNDAILHCFTRDMGFQAYFLRGIYSAKSKKKAYLLPLNEITFVTNDFQRSGITTISRIEQVKSLDCHTDVRASAVVFFIAEFLHWVLKKELKQDLIYDAIGAFINQLENKNYQAHLAFLVEFLRIQGIAPLLGGGVFLDPELGSFQEEPCHKLFDENISTQWKSFLSEDLIYNIKVKKALKGDFLDSVLLYYYCHFPEFKTPKSLEVLQQIFAE